METRVAGDHPQSASRYLVEDPRNASRSNPSMPRSVGIASPVPAMSPPTTTAAAAMQRPRIRISRVPISSLRYEVPTAFDVEDTPMAAAAPLAFDEDFQLDDELKMDFDHSMRAHRRPQRIKYVKCKTRVLPDLLVPYLYAGDRRSRMNAIMDRTGCTIDYCPESPDDTLDMLQPQRSGNHYLMCFLVAAETSGQLEAATRLLHVLVDRVQAHVDFKLAAGAGSRNSEVDSTPRQTHGGELHSPRSPLRRRTEIGLDGIDSYHLKAESGVGIGAMGAGYERRNDPAPAKPTQAGSPPGRMMLAQERDVRWTNERSTVDSHAWHERTNVESNQARVHQPGTRIYRPRYRRVLVDEAGYEVFERPHYEYLQRYSPQQSGHASSPPLRRRQTHEPIYRHGTSSEEESHLRSGVGLSVRSSAAVTQRSGPAHSDKNYRTPMQGEMIEQPTRRGMKRRLETYEIDDIFTRPRTTRRGPSMYNYMSDDHEAEYVLSGDELVDDMYDENNSARSYRRQHRATSNAHGNHDHQPVEPAECNDSSGEDRRMDPGGSKSNHVTETAEVNQSSDVDKPNIEYPRAVDASTTMIESESVSSPSTLFPLQAPVSTSVSIAFNHSVVDSTAPPYDTETVAEVASPSFVLTDTVNLSESSTNKGTADQRNGTRADEPVIFSTSTTRATSPVQSQRGIPDLDANFGSQPKSHNETEVAEFCSSAEKEGVALSDGVITPVPIPVLTAKSPTLSERAILNEVMINRFSSDSVVSTNSKQMCTRVIVVARELAELTNQARSHEVLQDLAHVVHGMEVSIWRLQSASLAEKQKVLTTLEVAINQASDSSKTIAERVSILQSGLQKVLLSKLLRANEIRASNDRFQREDCEEEDTKDMHATDYPKPITHPKPIEYPPPSDIHLHVQVNDGVGATNSRPTAQVEKTNSSKLCSAPVNPKPKLSIPAEAPIFVSTLVTEMERTSGLSTVMFSAQKRLLREISKSDPYYYLHPMVLLESTRKGRGKSCPFGCVGISAHKWERKVVSQISSRMKWFDSVAYSLAKVSGGKELLSRKKMNSTIRKLHLVALQLHCLIAHLFCIRKRVVCKEIDSLPTALNNSYYEKRMNGYKSRLKLTLHQQPPPMSVGIAFPTEELVRDTFEFYPELLLSIDIWGHDYRQDNASASKLPSDLLRSAARRSFDFESDTNGLLQGICEELLGILCLWNDFKWGESLESLSTDDIVEFEFKVKTSIRKILEAHASHLLSQWSSHLSITPAMLNHIRLTQANVYYSEQPSSVGIASNSGRVGQSGLIFRRDEDDEDERQEDDKDEEDMILQDFWRTRFTPSTSSTDADASDCTKSDDVQPPLNLSPLRADVLMSTAQDTKNERALSWSEVYDLRQQCHMHAGNTERLMVGDSSPCDVFHLLNHLTQARSIVEDAIRTSEKLALHSVHHQLDEPDPEKTHRDAVVGAGSLADVESMSEESRDEEDAMVDALLTGKDLNDQEKDSEGPEKGDDANDEDAWKQPVLNDLVEIVNSTNQEMSEICGQRARSARVRDKLQSRSLELARQSIQIFQTILNMQP